MDFLRAVLLGPPGDLSDCFYQDGSRDGAQRH